MVDVQFKSRGIFFFLIIILLLPLSEIKSQDISAGINLGGGSISGNTTNLGSYDISVFVQTESFFENDLYFRLTGLYCGDVDQILGTIRSYTPFLKGLSLTGVTMQTISGSIYAEEGGGFLYLNDRTIPTTNADDYGVTFSLLAGIDLTGFGNNGFKLGVGMNYGITFNSTLAKYYNFYLQVHYFL
jgi:hypothetical protein